MNVDLLRRSKNTTWCLFVWNESWSAESKEIVDVDERDFRGYKFDAKAQNCLKKLGYLVPILSVCDLISMMPHNVEKKHVLMYKNLTKEKKT